MMSVRLMRTWANALCAVAVIGSAGAEATAAPASSIDSSNRLAMKLANKRPVAKFHGATVVSPPGMWLSYAALYVSAKMNERVPSAISRARQSDLLHLADTMGYSQNPAHSRVLTDAADLKASAHGSDISMRLWTHAESDIDSTTRPELARLGVSTRSEPVDATNVSPIDLWLNQGTAFGPLGFAVADNTGVLLTTVKQRLAFPSPFRDASDVSPRLLPTGRGEVPSLPGKPIAYFNDSTSVTGIRLDSVSGRFFIFTGSSDDLKRMLDTLSLERWAEMKSRFKTKPGRIVDGFHFESSYDLFSFLPMYNLPLWGSGVSAGLQLGSIDVDTDRLDVVGTTEFVARGCCVDFAINPQSESQFQWSSLAPLVFIDEAPSGLIIFLGYSF